MSVYIDNFRELSRKAQAGFAALVLTATTIVPVVIQGSALAAPALLERELQSTTARVSQTTDLTWIFDTTSDVANIDHIEIQFCDAPLGDCNTTRTPAIAASPTATLTNFTTGGNSASRTNGDGGVGGTNNQILVDKTTADAGASLDEATISLAPTDITNNATANATYYTRMRVYSDTGTTLVWEGVFAQSTSQTLTINARVQERLDFCVGATAVDDDTTSVGAACSNVTGNTVDIGNVESGVTNVSPVATSNGGTNQNGVAMVRTNAVNGVVVDYKSILNTSSGALKVPGATCGAIPSTTGTDQCFNTSTTPTTVVSGTEEFGMVVAGVNCGSSTAYGCNFTGGIYNLVRDVDYDGGAAPNNVFVSETNTNGQVSGTTTYEYAWDATGTADRIASSAGSTVKVVDDEALILKFAATAGITTPTGSYTVQADYIATATF